MRQLEYQARTIRTFEGYLLRLVDEKNRSDQIAELARQRPDLGLDVPDFTAKTWESMREEGWLPASRSRVAFSPRLDGMDRPVPNVVYKVPTGGGKTFLAIASLTLILGRYLAKNTGFVLWIVPNEAIYTQTLRQLSDRQHPYRQLLDRAAAGRVRILEKDDRLDVRDVESNLCVMLLMLQSANRQTRESLKMFQDRGDVYGFFPAEGDQDAHRAALSDTPNLDAYSLSGTLGSFWPMVKDSLGNVLRVIRPIVVMDEGHRAVSELAFSTLYGFNPCFVLELTATPKDIAATEGPGGRPARPANVLVDVLGIELEREGMIKMPLNLDPRQSTDWRATLGVALARLDELQRAADEFHAQHGRYIRPIMLVQVERTGDDQRDGLHIHSLDVRDWLKTAGLDGSEIAIKTAAVNDLNSPENQDLLSPTNRVRVIITKQALQEGWDCPFAYVLCSLSASSNLAGMTQLVGRILRQPQAEKTGTPLLDECYVITHHADTANVVQAIKRGLEEDGLGDLVREIKVDELGAGSHGPRLVKRRAAFRAMEIYLPQVVIIDDGISRLLDYETDILYRIDWSGIDPRPLVSRIPANVQAAERQLQRIRLGNSNGSSIVSEGAGSSAEMLAFDPSYAVRMISDIVPNPWIAREMVSGLLDGLSARGFSDEKLGGLSGLIVEELRRWLDEKRTAMAEELFRADMAIGKIQFRLRMDARLNWSMPIVTETFEPERARQLLGNCGGPLQRSLFAPIYEGDFSGPDERAVAVYLDGEAALQWWHRNVARAQYSIQGWNPQRIYPDFIFAVGRRNGSTRIAIVEMKGEHLVGNEDTEYKRAVLELMSQHFGWDMTPPSGQLPTINPRDLVVDSKLVPFEEWQIELPLLLNTD